MLVDFYPFNAFLKDLVVVPALPDLAGESEDQLSFSLPGLESLSVEFSGSLQRSISGKFIVSRFTK